MFAITITCLSTLNGSRHESSKEIQGNSKKKNHVKESLVRRTFQFVYQFRLFQSYPLLDFSEFEYVFMSGNGIVFQVMKI